MTKDEIIDRSLALRVGNLQVTNIEKVAMTVDLDAVEQVDRAAREVLSELDPFWITWCFFILQVRDRRPNPGPYIESLYPHL